MAIMDDSYERDMMKIWTLVVDLSEQLSHTKQQADALRSHSMILKVCVVRIRQCCSRFLTAFQRKVLNAILCFEGASAVINGLVPL